VTPPAIKKLALELGLPVIQPEKLRQPEVIEQLKAWQPDVIVLAAFGQILRPNVLELPQHGCVNVHASLLPRWRGAAPIQAAILHGDAQTGITIMRMDAGLDTGPIISQRPLPILEEDNSALLSERLANLGSELLLETLPEYLKGKLQPRPQDEALSTYCKMLKKEDGALDFSCTSTSLEHKVRAFQPWPGAFTTWQGQILKIQHSTAVPGDQLEKMVEPGQHVIFRGLPAIGTGDGLLVLNELQPAGKKPMNGKAFLQGARNWV
jgi:methionyl-tRNA formyltransferase